MKKREWKRLAREAHAEVEFLRRARWYELPQADRAAIVESWINERAMRRAAMSPFPRSFEDEINNAGVDIVRDFNRRTF